MLSWKLSNPWKLPWKHFGGSFRGSYSAVTFHAHDGRFTLPIFFFFFYPPADGENKALAHHTCTYFHSAEQKKNAHTPQDPHHRISRAFLGTPAFSRVPVWFLAQPIIFFEWFLFVSTGAEKQGFCFDKIHIIIKIKIHSSCEIEYFVETHLSLQAVCDTPIARITGCVSSLRM